MVELIIRLDDTGQIKVGGPIHDKSLAYGLLEAAKDVIRDFHVQHQQRVQLVAAETIPPTAMRKIF